MKRLVTFAALAALLLPDVAAAQMNGPGPGGNRPGENRPGQGNNNRPGGGSGGANTPAPGNNNRPGGNDNRPGGGGMRPPGNNNRPGIGGPSRPSGPGMRPPSGGAQWSWRGRNFDRIRGPAFRYPSGYSYRRWSVGTLLPSLFLSSLYYYNDWRTIGLDAPGPHRRWVRYGSDLLLVNTRTRRIEDVIYDVFY